MWGEEFSEAPGETGAGLPGRTKVFQAGGCKEPSGVCPGCLPALGFPTIWPFPPSDPGSLQVCSGTCKVCAPVSSAPSFPGWEPLGWAVSDSFLPERYLHRLQLCWANGDCAWASCCGHSCRHHPPGQLSVAVRLPRADRPGGAGQVLLAVWPGSRAGCVYEARSGRTLATWRGTQA